ncbi:hypothetical protein LO771_22685 [Streptacidiphilus sp. ASG 303]|uniref:hypothetical protein n=1 Tax=Streptacidiphilus sp. ASG 303 TaxID=2896847 RepID=UPI001E519123|nr:hypothetical protein [Streptacidiphilus sp. ASG 303]MCD0485111.1 hypothetical protein [Streptacidiphilus sp. ASG 303]
MRRGILQTGAWAAATGAAVSLSWLGVHAVLSDGAFDPPRTPAVPAPGAPDGPDASSTRLPEGELGPATARAPQPSRTPQARSSPSLGRAGRVPGPRRPGAPPSAGGASPGVPGGDVRSVSVDGGRVAVEFHPDSAELVSAAPEPGWEMQVWHGDGWLRVDFSRDGVTDSVFVTWNGHPPAVQTVEG